MADEQTPKPFGDKVDPQEFGAEEPAGEFLTIPVTSQDHAVVDGEAEELTSPEAYDPTPGRADPADAVVDDAQQLEAAEQVAARARSSRPVRRKNAPPAVDADDSVAIPEGAGATVAPRPVVQRPVRRGSSPVQDAPATQDVRAPRPSRRQVTTVVEPARRASPGLFVNQSAAELRKVIWPTANQLRQYFIVVLLFVLFIVAYVGLLDALFGWIMLKLFGN